ncbi:hypothetical protein FHP05_06340 [Cerasibacillus terrae]|uniref:Uncharacterized protein n=2 Tax=Cerasibacillus terrae TaxID=2498845 RepID=A0A5C8NWW8_9BACI|nr:hypothetical protein FHP05_06340 [Cerasibacillus terrae]
MNLWYVYINPNHKRCQIMGILIVFILIVFLFDFTKFRKQNNTIIEQNEQIIALLEKIKNDTDTNKSS